MRKKRLLVAGLAVLLLAGFVILLWTALRWPPPLLVLRYGFSPDGGPTGRTETVCGIELVEIGPGCFRMGSTYEAKGDLIGKICAPLGLPWGEKPESSDEMPVHWVEFRRGFWIARREVTNAQYERFDPDHERSAVSPGDDDPVVDVTWDEASAFCAWLAGKSGLPIRLPSESEWERACRAGTRTEYGFGEDEANLGEYGWFAGNSGGRARPVGTRLPNAWGLHDLHGNVWVWCADTWHDDYVGAPADGSAWVEEGAGYRVVRGGCWGNGARGCRSACRSWRLPAIRWNYLGFRPARPSPP